MFFWCIFACWIFRILCILIVFTHTHIYTSLCFFSWSTLFPLLSAFASWDSILFIQCMPLGMAERCYCYCLSDKTITISLNKYWNWISNMPFDDNCYSLSVAYTWYDTIKFIYAMDRYLTLFCTFFCFFSHSFNRQIFYVQINHTLQSMESIGIFPSICNVFVICCCCWEWWP